MINIFTILIIIYILNICILSSINNNNNNLNLRADGTVDTCDTELTTWGDPTALSQFSTDVSKDTPPVTTNKYFTKTNYYIYKTTADSGEVKETTEIYVYNSTVKKDTDKNYAELEYQMYAKGIIIKGESSADDVAKCDMICNNDIPLGDCQKQKLFVGKKTIGSGNTDIYVDKCGITEVYTGTIPTVPPLTYTRLATSKDKILKTSLSGKRLSMTRDGKLSTTYINPEVEKYCHINNLGGYYMIFIGTIGDNVIPDGTTATGTGLISFDHTNVKFYNFTESSTSSIICGDKSSSDTDETTVATTEEPSEQPPPETNQDGSVVENILNSLIKESTAECTDKYTFKIETDNVDKHYFYLGDFYLGELDDKSYSIPKSIYDGIPSDEQWCFNNLEINKISFININIFIMIIIIILLSL